MTGDAFLPLVQSTLRTPRVAAEQIMDWQLSRDTLWTALALVAVLNTFVFILLLQVSEPSVALPGYFKAPLALYVLWAGFSVIYVHTIYWAGLAIGGQGTLGDVLALVVWLLVLRALAQLAVLILVVIVPSLALILSLVIAVWGLWILLVFMTTAMNLPTVAHALAAIIIGGVGLVLGLGVLLSLISLAAQGVLSNV